LPAASRHGATPIRRSLRSDDGNPNQDNVRSLGHAGSCRRRRAPAEGPGNEKRLQILCLLADGERSVGEINDLLDLSQSALSQHLAVLREENLVKTRREAQTIFYSLMPGPGAEVMGALHGIYCAPLRTRGRKRAA